jgi:hypothetical protein
MRKIRNRAWGFVGAAALAAGLSACASAPPPDAVYVETAPPPPMRTEKTVPTPGPGFIWVPGSWNWGGTTYVWVGGGWEQPPRPAARWVAPRWRHTSRGWYRVDGYWR